MGKNLTYLERVFPREALVAVPAWEGLDREMYPLMPLQVVIPVEALRALVASKRSVVLWCTLLVHLLYLCRVSAVVIVDHAVRHPAHHLQVAAWIADVGKNGTLHHTGWRVGVWSLVVLLLRRWNRSMCVDWRPVWRSSCADRTLLH
jgi:hypothetical protein